jgi:hypothetical protein
MKNKSLHKGQKAQQTAVKILKKEPSYVNP